MNLVGDLGGFSNAPMTAPAAATGGMTPQQKVAMALQMHRGLFPQKSGWGGGLNLLGQAGLLAAGLRRPKGPGPQP